MPIDIKILEEFLECDGFIAEGDIITKEMTELFLNYKVLKISALFTQYPNRNNSPPKYSVDVVCSFCSDNALVIFSKTRYLQYFKDSIYEMENPYDDDRIAWKCQDCSLIYEEERKRIKEREQQAYQLDIIQRKKEIWEVVENYWLNPNHPCSFKALEFINLPKMFHLIEHELAEKIGSLPYSEYLKTPLWKLTAWYVKKRAKFKCRLCNSSENLHTHHSTYKRKGYEYDYWNEDLICICNDCHKNHHRVED